MHVHLDYGTGGLTGDFPDDRTTVIEPVYRSSVPDPHLALIQAMRAPLGKVPLKSLVRPGQHVGISVCDITRAQPRQLMLDALFAEMPGIRMEDVTIFIATGTHRRNTDEELQAMLGPDIARRCPIICHNSRDEAALIHAGDTSTGVRVMLNRAWVEAEFKITTGFVEPHFFAGFSGGPKMVAPGLAGLSTVLQLHDAARIGHPNATWGITAGNPVHDDVREISQMTGVDFALDVTLNRDRQITAAFAGDLLQEHATACGAAKNDAMQAVEHPFDVVVTTNSGYPLDQNLYQAVKGMSAAVKIVKPGGVIICVAECRDGLPAHGPFGQILSSAASPRELLTAITSPGYSRQDQWQVQILAQILLKARVLLKSDYLSDAQIRAAHLEPAHDVSAAAAEALRKAGPLATLCVLPQGPQTIPYLRG